MCPRAKYERLGVADRGDYEELRPWLRVKFKNFTLTTCSLPLFAFFFCICYSLAVNFNSATYTTCGAYNVLPSISAAIGGFSPQREVWTTLISIDFLPRIILLLVFVKYNIRMCQESSNFLIYFLAVLNCTENCALVLLSYYDSTYNYSIHKNSFIVFVLTSQLYMLLLICQKITQNQKSLSKSEQYGLKLRIFLAGMNIGGILLAMYYFIDHTNYCEDFAYTKFAFCEYVVVLTNIAYHFTIVYDFPSQNMSISPKYLIKLDMDFGIRHQPLISNACGYWRKNG